MRKTLIHIIICILILSILSGSIFLKAKINSEKIRKHNVEFENYYNKEIFGVDIATNINKAINYNEKNYIEKDEKGNYINNDKNSIKIEIKMIDNDNIYSMETIYNSKISEFMKYYSNIKFKCTKLEYHKKTKMIKYMLFEQISI